MNIVPAGSATTTYFWEIVRGATTSGGSWATSGSVEYNLLPSTTPTVSGGTTMASGFFISTTQSKDGIDSLKEALFKFQLLRNGLTNTPIELTIVC